MNTTPTHTAKSVAEHLRVSASTVYRWLKNGEIVKHGYTGAKVNGRWAITATSAASTSDRPATGSRQTDSLDTQGDMTSAASTSIDDAIITAYTALARKGDWVRLDKIRKGLGDWTRAEVDEALLRLFNRQQINLDPEMNRHRLVADVEYRASGIYIGGEDRHLMQIY